MRTAAREGWQSFCQLGETQSDHRDDVVARAACASAEKAGHIVAHLEANVNLPETGAEAQLSASA